MANWWNMKYKLMPLIHIIGLLTLWVFVVVLLGVEQNNSLMLKLDQVRTYTLQKQPLYYNEARKAIDTKFQSLWTPAAENCLSQTVINTSQSCWETRTNLVTTTRAALNCDLLRSTGCNCINQVLSRIANDLTGNVIGSSFSHLAKNLSGQQANVLNAIEACHFLHHPPNVASQSTSDTPLIRRVGLLFLFSTMLTGNAVLFFLFPRKEGSWGYTTLRILGIVIWPFIGAIVPVALESGLSNIILLILLPSLLILIWYVCFLRARCIRNKRLTYWTTRRYEFILLSRTSKHRAFFFHPFFFAVILPITSVQALIENNALDYDNINFEILKCHMISLLYFGVYWFNAQMQSNEGRTFFSMRPQQEALLIAVVLPIISLVTTAVAPYTSVGYSNYLMYIPLLFAVVAFQDVYCWSHLGTTENEMMKDSAHDAPRSIYWVSNMLLVLKALVVFYYWREYSTIYHAMFQNLPMRSIQCNASYTWLNANF